MATDLGYGANQFGKGKGKSKSKSKSHRSSATSSRSSRRARPDSSSGSEDPRQNLLLDSDFERPSRWARAKQFYRRKAPECFGGYNAEERTLSTLDSFKNENGAEVDDLLDQKGALDRKIAMSARAYKDQVAAGTMTIETAQQRLARKMTARRLLEGQIAEARSREMYSATAHTSLAAAKRAERMDKIMAPTTALLAKTKTALSASVRTRTDVVDAVADVNDVRGEMADIDGEMVGHAEQASGTFDTGHDQDMRAASDMLAMYAMPSAPRHAVRTGPGSGAGGGRRVAAAAPTAADIDSDTDEQMLAGAAARIAAAPRREKQAIETGRNM